MAGFTHLWSKRIDDLTREGLRKLEDEDYGELSPWNTRVMAFMVRVLMLLAMEQRRLLISGARAPILSGHEEKNGGGGRREGGKREGKEGQTLEKAGWIL